MAGPQRKVSFFLTGSVDEQQFVEFQGPIVQQGGTPNLDDSRNTRLSLERGTCVRAPDVTPLGVDLPNGTRAYGIVGNEQKQNYALYLLPDQGTRVVGEDGFEPRANSELRAPWTGYVGQQSLYLPMHIASAGQLPGPITGVGYEPPILAGVATCYNPEKDELWYAWTELQDVTSGDVITWVSCYAGDGTQLAVPSVVDAEATHRPTMRLVGLTAHGANGVRLWFGAGTTGSSGSECYRYKTLTVVGAVPNAGASVLLPTSAGVPSLWGHFSVCAQDSTYAYLAASGASSAGVLSKVNVNTGAIAASITFAGAMLNGGFCSVFAMQVAGAWRVAAAFGSEAGATMAVLNDLLVAVVPTTTNTLWCRGVASKFMLVPSRGNFAVFATSYMPGPSSAACRTIINAVNLSGGAVTTSPVMYWQKLYDQGAQWDVSATESYPLFTLARDYTMTLVAGDRPPQLLDPSLEVYLTSYWQGSQSVLASPVARMGCVRGVMSPVAIGDYVTIPTTTSAPRIVNDIFFTYRKADTYCSARFVKLSTLAEQPAVVNDKDGIAIVAAALPVQYDGVETLEYGGPLHAPQLMVNYAGAGDPFLDQPPSGQYGFCAVFEWIDAAGLSHRSMPSVTISMHFDGTQKVKLRGLSPDIMHLSWVITDLAFVVYRTGPDGTAYERYAIDYSATNGFYDTFQLTLGVDPNPIVYSRGTLGEELTPQPPPPLRDITIVGSRCWGIDAEIPTRIVYSKLRVAGIGFEFCPALEVIVPSNAGDVIALREQSGALIVFTERAIYQVSDGGPNNMGSGSFGSPYKISDIGTKNRRAVVSTAQGVMFLDNAGCFSMLRGSAVVQLPGAAVRQNVIGAFVLEDAEEVVFPVGGNEAKVYNYALSRWTNWDLPETPLLVAQSAITRNAGLMYGQGTGRTYTVLSTVPSTTALMSWETDWILFGGDAMDYTVLYDVIFSAYNLSDHGIRMELCTEYNGVTATTSREWTAAELTALTGPTRRYTVRIEPVRQDTRGAKIKISELVNAGDHRGMRPLALTIVHSIDGLTYEESNIPGSHK